MTFWVPGAPLGSLCWEGVLDLVLALFCQKSVTCLFLKENMHLATCGALLWSFVGNFVMHSA